MTTYLFFSYTYRQYFPLKFLKIDDLDLHKKDCRIYDKLLIRLVFYRNAFPMKLYVLLLDLILKEKGFHTHPYQGVHSIPNKYEMGSLKPLTKSVGYNLFSVSWTLFISKFNIGKSLFLFLIANTSDNRKLLKDPSRDPKNRAVPPLPPGWRK